MFLAALVGKALGAEAGECRPKVLPVFQRPPAAEAWQATNAPSDVQRIVARGEWVNVSFCLLPAKDAADVRARPLVLRNGDKEWQTGAQLRIVHTWPQIDYSSAGSMFAMVEPYDQYLRPTPELLLTDDTVEPKESWDGNTYVAPSFPKEFHTTVAKGKVKWLWLSVRIPQDLAAGRYEGKLEILADGNVMAGLPISLDVLDADLPDPGKVYGLFVRASRNPGEDVYVDDTRYHAQLHAMRELGINALKLDAFWPHQLDKLDEALKWIREEGFSGPIVLQAGWDVEYIKKCAALLVKYNYPPLFYGVDEPGMGDPKTDEAYRNLAKMIHDGGGKVVSAMRPDVAASNGYVKDGLIDVPILNHYYVPATEVSMPYVGPEKWTAPMDDATRFVSRLYYWQSWTENQESFHRRSWGFYLYRSNFDGVMPYCLMAFQKGLPYHTDLRFYDYLGKRRSMKMFCTAYPSQDGLVPTLQWEAAREGITDMRWIRLYEQTDKASGGALGRLRLEQALQPFYYRGGDGIHSVMADEKANPEPEPKAFEDARQLLIDAVAGYVKDKAAAKFALATHMDVGNPEQERLSAIYLSFFGKPETLGGKRCRNTDWTGEKKSGWSSYIYLRLDDLDSLYQVTLQIWGKSEFGGLLMQDQATGKWNNIGAANLSGKEQWDTYTVVLPVSGYDAKSLLQTLAIGGPKSQNWISEIEITKLRKFR